MQTWPSLTPSSPLPPSLPRHLTSPEFLRRKAANRELKPTTKTTTTTSKKWFYEQNNSSARASRFLVHFFDVHCTIVSRFYCRHGEERCVTTLKTLYSRLTAPLRRETSQCDVLWRTWTYDDKLPFLYLNMDKVVKNSTPGKLAYI